MPKKFARRDTSATFTGTFSNYRGKNAHLDGKIAVLRNHPRDARSYRAQFDDTSLSEAYGWWDFEKADFKNVKPPGDKT